MMEMKIDNRGSHENVLCIPVWLREPAQNATAASNHTVELYRYIRLILNFTYMGKIDHWDALPGDGELQRFYNAAG
jgi:hypothetical protein